MSGEVPRVGVGVFVLNTEGKFVMGIRKGSLGSGTLALPGGHLDFGETFEACAEREVWEETGLGVKNLFFLTAVNSVLEKEHKHYVTIFVVAEVCAHQEPRLMEPDKCEGWFWVDWEEMRAWAISQLRDEGLGSNGLDDTGISASVPNKTQPKLFLPLLKLVRDRPEVRPRPASSKY